MQIRISLSQVINSMRDDPSCTLRRNKILQDLAGLTVREVGRIHCGVDSLSFHFIIMITLLSSQSHCGPVAGGSSFWLVSQILCMQS